MASPGWDGGCTLGPTVKVSILEEHTGPQAGRLGRLSGPHRAADRNKSCGTLAQQRPPALSWRAVEGLPGFGEAWTLWGPNFTQVVTALRNCSYKGIMELPPGPGGQQPPKHGRDSSSVIRGFQFQGGQAWGETCELLPWPQALQGHSLSSGCPCPITLL
jgi:hypothetical protein